MSISRHKSLRPFSRDHFVGLFHAQRLKQASQAHPRFKPLPVLDAFKKSWAHEISVHFEDEERALSTLSLKAESLERLLTDHAQLRASIGRLLSAEAAHIDVESMFQVGSMLEDHIRWEEHVLFPEIEALSLDQIQWLEEVTAKIEESRLRKQLKSESEFSLLASIFIGPEPSQ